MQSRNEELPLAAEIQETEERLHLRDALLRVLQDPTGLMDLLLVADDVDGARRSLRDLFGLDEVQATAVIDMQFRRATRREQAKIHQEHADLTAHLEYLRSLRGLPTQ